VTVKLDVAVVSFGDLIAHDGFAIAVSGIGVELARTTVGAIAVRELDSTDFPRRHQ
jgi:hypothetical protein